MLRMWLAWNQMGQVGLAVKAMKEKHKLFNHFGIFIVHLN